MGIAMRLVLASLLLLGVTAQAATVTFEDITPTGACGLAPVPCQDSITTTEGFVFSHTGSSGDYQTVHVISDGPDGNFLETSFPPESGASLRIEHESNQAFDVQSLDTRAWDNSVYVSGYDQDDNLIVSEEFVFESSSWVTVEFDDAWNSVYSIELSEYFYCSFGCAWVPNAIDNFSATVVPIPAAVWLFGSGLIGLIGVARRKA